VQFHALVRDVRFQASLRSVILPSYRCGKRNNLVFSVDWPSILDHAEAGRVDVAILDSSAWSQGSIPCEDFSVLHQVLARGRVILRLSPHTISPSLLADLHTIGFRLIHTAGIDDDQVSLERSLGGAASAVALSHLEDRLRGRIPDAALELTREALASWRPGRDASQVASELGMDTAYFRSLLTRYSLPSCREYLGWGRLFFARGCFEVRDQTVARLAYILGYEDRSSLCRLCRRLTKRQAREVFSPDRADVVTEAMARRLAG